MITKSPSQFDGKPIGTPTEIKSPFHAGVTMGKDQAERMDEARRLRNRALKAQAKADRRARHENSTPEEHDAYKLRRKRADNMTRALRNGKKVQAVASYWGVTTDDVLAEVKWLSGHRNRHRARHRSQDAKVYPVLPDREKGF